MRCGNPASWRRAACPWGARHRPTTDRDRRTGDTR
nr:MAG TPA: hypothetical protein [Caudoviricetes sp.]